MTNYSSVEIVLFSVIFKTILKKKKTFGSQFRCIVKCNAVIRDVETTVFFAIQTMSGIPGCSACSSEICWTCWDCFPYCDSDVSCPSPGCLCNLTLSNVFSFPPKCSGVQESLLYAAANDWLDRHGDKSVIMLCHQINNNNADYSCFYSSANYSAEAWNI